ncbi:hypothetical protein [Luteolibacter soli]|uniref:Uncharacterized protein n=1 Tax=Luteolibacter soli TaxID=3135280 RepID=A0ABU9ATP8_9BACT
MSKRVVIICLSLCLVGCVFGWGLGGLLLTGGYRHPGGWWPMLLLLGGFLCLPAGIGMIMGYRLGRTVAVAAFAVGYLACAAMLVAPLLQAGVIDIAINGSRAGYGVYAAGSLMLLGVVLLLHWTLYTPSFEDHLA